MRSKWLAANLVLVVLFKYHVGLVDDESLSKTAHVVERSYSRDESFGGWN
jgi:hypothetical protein